MLFQHTESHLGKRQAQAKIPIAFLFSQLQDTQARQVTEVGQDTQARQVTEVGQDTKARQVTEAGQDTKARQVTPSIQDTKVGTDTEANQVPK